MHVLSCNISNVLVQNYFTLCFCQVKLGEKEPTTVGAAESRETSYEYNIVKNVVDLFLFCLFVGRKGGWDCDHTLHGT